MRMGQDSVGVYLGVEKGGRLVGDVGFQTMFSPVPRHWPGGGGGWLGGAAG